MRKRRIPSSNTRAHGTLSPPPHVLARKRPQSTTNGQTLRVSLLTILSVGASVGFLYYVYPRLAKSLRPDLFPPTADDSSNTSIGGWRLPDAATLAAYDTGICNIDQRSAEELSPAQFEAEYRFKKPVILKFKNGARNWTNPEMWTRHRLKAAYGQWSLLSGNSLEIVRHGGRGEHKSSFTDFVDGIMNGADPTGEQYYVFDRDFYKESDLPKSLSMPPYLAVQDNRDDSIFFLGASGSGVSFHKHADGWNGVVYGRKRWFLYPAEKTPPGGMYPGFTQLDWYQRLYPELSEKDKPMECVQEAGDILYLPESTYHATINLGDTIALGIQRNQATLPAEKLFYRDFALTREIRQSPTPEKHMEQLEIQNKLLHLLPDNAEVKMKAGAKLLEIGKLAEALKLTEDAIAMDKHFIVAILIRAKILTKLGRKKEAEEIYVDIMTNKNQHLWDVYSEYGTFLFGEQRYPEAAEVFRKGAELRPDMVPFWYHLKQSQEAMGETAAAAKTQQRIDELKRK